MPSIVKGQTIRVIVANADALAKRKDVIARFMHGLSRGDRLHVFDNPQVHQRLCGVRRRRPSRWPSACATISSRSRCSEPDEIKGLDTLMPEAVVAEIHHGAADGGRNSPS